MWLLHDWEITSVLSKKWKETYSGKPITLAVLQQILTESFLSEAFI